MALTKVQTIGIETGISLTGVTTVTTLNASTDTLSVGGTVNFGGNVSIAGTLTYEDVTNIDAVGLITARSGINVTSGRVLVNTTTVLESISAAKLHIAHTSGSLIALGRDDSSVAAGNDIGKIAFYGNDGGSYEKVAQITCEADGSHASGDKPGRLTFSTTADGASSPTERMRIDSSGNVGIGALSPSDYSSSADDLVIAGSGQRGITIASTDSTQSNIFFADATSGSGEFAGYLAYIHGSDAFAFGVNGSERMRIDSSGNFGLGTSSPSNVLHINQTDATANSYVHITHADSGSAGTDGLSIGIEDGGVNAVIRNRENGYLRMYTNNTERMRINSSGNIGIGHDSPSSLLTVGGDAITTAKPTVCIATSSGNGSLTLRGGSPTLSFDRTSGGDGTIIYDSNSNLLFKNGSLDSSTEHMRLDSSGRLLIGTSDLVSGSGNTNLQIVSTGGGEIALARNDGSVGNGNELGRIRFFGNDGGSYVESARIEAEASGTHSASSKPTQLKFFTCPASSISPTERMRIESGGSVLIGSSIISDNTNGEGILFTDGGFIRLGNTTGSGSASMAQFKTGSGNTEVLRFMCDGDLENQNNRYGSISDANLKENIVDAGSQWNDIKNIRVRKYNFRGDLGYNTHTQIGVIAQELEQTCPGLVEDSYDLAEDGSNLETSRKSVSYSVLYMKAVKALQEAMARIEVLEARIAALEGS